ncbi:PAS domain-containing sensor histidine kinase [Acidisphaera sp. L21]|uniref:hybrid sensor histidine kinase/response regulator n=1 Tax=Acidisphaera sp. L21 TaxID=1641851 RepID=UPI001C2060F6|nr:PAS domain-containing hybrid sensor histidine kinase/response regulator [Acidisphaera sp. L21]
MPEETLDELYEHAPCGYLTTTVSGTIVRANATFLEWLGRTRDGVIGQRVQALLTAGARIFYETHCAQVLRRDGLVRQAALDLSRADGSKLPALIEWRPMRNAEEVLIGLRVLVVDATDRRSYERELIAERERAQATAEALRELNETLEHRVEERTRELHDTKDFARLALQSVGGVGVWTYDVASDRFVCDDNIAELYALESGRGAKGFSSAEFLQNLHPDDDLSLRKTMSGGLVNPGDLEQEYRIRHADGSVRWVLSRGHTYFEDGKPIRRTGVGVDMTQQRLLEEQFRQAQKMEAVGQLTGGLAHDFNNLLAGISGALEMMETRISQGRLADVDRYMVAAKGASRRAAALTHRLLAFSRRQTLDPKPTNVNRLVASMQDLIQRTVGPAVLIEVVGASALWSVLVDPPQLENALLNLCINGRDAMPNGGRITIETANKWVDARAARQHDMPEGQYLSLCVTDTGVGMSAELISRVFEPFFTTKPLGEGTGLGLSMIYGFARQSGGQVRVYSEVGQGTTVCIYLPRHHGDALEDEGEVVLPVLPRAKESKTVLVVDDEPTVRMLLTDILDDLGCTSIEAADSMAGLKILQSNVPIDLLVTDVGLPGGMNGRQMADAARVTRTALKVMFITGYAENAAIGNGHLEPGMAVLTKPFAVDTMVARIRSMMEI